MKKLTKESAIVFDEIHNLLMDYTVEEREQLKFKLSASHNKENVMLMGVSFDLHCTATGLYRQLEDIYNGKTEPNALGRYVIGFIEYAVSPNYDDKMKRAFFKTFEVDIETVDKILYDDYDSYCNLCDMVKCYTSAQVNYVYNQLLQCNALVGLDINLIATVEGIDKQIANFQSYNDLVSYVDIKQTLDGIEYSIKTLRIRLDANHA